MESNLRKDSHQPPQQYQNILLPVIVTATNTSLNTSALNNNNSASTDAVNSITNCANASDNASPRTQIACDKTNSTTISTTVTTNNEQSANRAENRRAPIAPNAFDCHSIEQRINSIRLEEAAPIGGPFDCARNTIDVTNNNATAIAVAAATRIPFELIEGSGLFSSAFPSLNSSLCSDGASLTASSSDHPLNTVVQCNLCQKKKKSHPKCCKTCNKDSKGKKANWSLRLNCAKLKRTASASSVSSIALSAPATPLTGSNALSTSAVLPIITSAADSTDSALRLSNAPFCDSSNVILVSMDARQRPLLDFTKFNPADYPIEDCERSARIQRAIEIEQGIEPPPGFSPSTSSSSATFSPALFTPASLIHGPNTITKTPTYMHMVCSSDAALRLMLPNFNLDGGPRIHSQIDFIHCLVPDLNRITTSTFYWGKMDRYEAERLLDGKPEGTFLLRDSAQEDFLFSVSFRKYGRSLHARIEQFNHKFSFDCHDPGVYTSSSVTGLLEHYKDPACVMFFEPALTLPLNRNFAFSLQQLCRASIVHATTYDGINSLSIPKQLKAYLKEYHYKQRVRVKKED